MKTLKWSLLVLAGLALLLPGCGSAAGATPNATTSAEPLPVIAEGHVVPAESLYLTFPARGRVQEILVQEGQTVRDGQVLVRLGDREQAQAALAAAQLAQEQAQQDYDDFTRTEDLASAAAQQAYLDAQVARAAAERRWEALNLDNITTRIDDAQSVVKDKKKILDDAQTTFDRYADLDKDNATRKLAEDALTQAQDNYNEAVRQLESIERERDSVRAALDLVLSNEAEAKHDYEATLDGPDPAKKALLQDRLQSAQAQAAAAQAALDAYDLKAPFAGTVADINVTAGQLVGPETWAVLIADFGQWYVDTSDLTELEVVKVVQGQPVTVTVDALPGVELAGTVDKVGQSFSIQGGDVLYTVHIRLTTIDPQLRWGMTVEVTFEPVK
jgi:multidrug efflux pump subunit AcrA (membrane-fusion protein)